MSVDSGNLSDSKKFHPQDKVLKIITPVLSDARDKAGYLSDHLEAMQKTFADVLTYYGEDPHDENSRKRFFKIIADFVKNYRVSHDKNMELEDEERRREKRQMLQNRQKAPDPLAPASGTNTGAMDVLLDKLRAAGPTPRDKRDERRRRARARQAAPRTAPTDEASDTPADPVPDPAASAEDGANPKSPDITISTPQEGTFEDTLTSRTQEILMKLRSDGGASSADQAAAPFGKGSIRDKRKERRRRQGSNVSTSSANGALGIMGMTPPMPPLPSPDSPGLGSPSLGVPGDEEDAVARAKNALLEMRRASDAGASDAGASVATGENAGDASDCAIVDDEETPETKEG